MMESDAIPYEGALTICLGWRGGWSSLTPLVGLDNCHDVKKVQQPN